jgi:hypothetical protein
MFEEFGYRGDSRPLHLQRAEKETGAPVITSEFYKVSMCKHFLAGSCPRGDKCTFAHRWVSLAHDCSSTGPSLLSVLRLPPVLCLSSLCSPFFPSRRFLMALRRQFLSSACMSLSLRVWRVVLS